MWSRVYGTVERPSVRLSVPTSKPRGVRRFAAERRAWNIDQTGAQQQRCRSTFWKMYNLARSYSVLLVVRIGELLRKYEFVEN